MVITLLSDLGLRDAAVATVKATLLGYVPGADIVDVSHSVALYDVQQAAYLLRVAYSHFPKGSVHIAAIDTLSGNPPRIVLGWHDGHYFIAPDNGLLQLIFRNEPVAAYLCHQLERPYTFRQWVDHAGSVLQNISSGNMAAYTQLALQPVSRAQPQVGPLGVDCNVLYVDRYDNVVLDLTRAEFYQLVKDRSFRIRILKMPDVTAVSNHYNEVKAGEPLCRFNSAGYMEIAVNHGSAATLLGLDASSGNLRYKTIRIFLD